ncbi:MAG: putative HTH-type transcriptional regulator [Ilumatobacteraceae bacterium]|nr:putative HTH-type transcriptional regulator [Ilumatobacteraceae bacterium]
MLVDRALHELSVDDIAAAAGTSKALVFHYFGSRPELLRAIAEAAADDFLERTEPDPALPLEDQLVQSMQAFVRYVADRRVGYVMLVRGPATADDAMLDLFEQTRGRIVDRIVSKLDTVDDVPSFRLVVRGWVAFAEEVTISWIGDPVVSEEQLLELLNHSLAQLVALALLGPGALVLPE